MGLFKGYTIKVENSQTWRRKVTVLAGDEGEAAAMVEEIYPRYTLDQDESYKIKDDTEL